MLSRVVRNSLILVLAVLVVASFGAGAPVVKDLNQDVTVGHELENCLFFTEIPGDTVTNGTQITVESFNWNCGNTPYNGTTWLRLYNATGHTQNLTSAAVNFSVGDYAFTEFMWLANTSGTYNITANTTYEGEIAGSSVSDTVSITHQFQVTTPQQETEEPVEEDTDDGKESTSGFSPRPVPIDREERTVAFDLQLPSDVTSVQAGSMLLAEATVENTGEVTGENMTITLDAPSRWRTGTAHIARIEPNETVTRDLLVGPPASANKGIHYLPGTLAMNDDAYDTDSLLVDVYRPDTTNYTAPDLTFTAFTPELSLLNGENDTIQYTLENWGNASTGGITVRLQNADRCVSHTATRYGRLEPDESLSGGIPVTARDVIATCNVTLIVEAQGTADAVTVTIAVEQREDFPTPLQEHLDRLPDLDGRTLTLLFLVTLLSIVFTLLHFHEWDHVKQLLGMVIGLQTVQRTQDDIEDDGPHKSFVCTECGDVFDSEHGLNVHDGMKHGDSDDIEQLHDRMKNVKERFKELDDEDASGQ